MSLYQDFQLALEEFDALIDEGFFGENVKQLHSQRDYLSANEHLYKCFLDWANDKNQYGKDKVAQLIIVFLKLYVHAWQGKNQDAIDILASVWKGTTAQPHLECTTAFIEYLRIHVECMHLISETSSSTPVSIAQKKKLGSSLINAYSKGVEFVNKILSRLVSLLQIANGNAYDLPALSDMPLFRKIECFMTLSNGTYDVLIAGLDREIRNADSHLSIYYNANESTYIIRTTTNKGKQGKTRKIRADIMIREIYPFVGWVNQAFVYSLVILFLAHEDATHFKATLKAVGEIGMLTEVVS